MTLASFFLSSGCRFEERNRNKKKNRLIGRTLRQLLSVLNAPFAVIKNSSEQFIYIVWNFVVVVVVVVDDCPLDEHSIQSKWEQYGQPEIVCILYM